MCLIPMCKRTIPKEDYDDLAILLSFLVSCLGQGTMLWNITIGILLYYTLLLYWCIFQSVVGDNGTIETYQNTTEGAEIFFRCNPGFVPAGRMRAVCGADGRWNPDPAMLVCTSKCKLYFDRCTLDNMD